MSIDLEQALRAAFRDAADAVVPSPEPMRRLLQRRRRRWTGIGAFLAAVAAVAGAALVPVLQPGLHDRLGEQGYPITSSWTHNLIDSPTRGSLAGSPLQADVERVIGERTGDAHLGKLKLLFLGDVAGRRFMAYTRYDDKRAALYYNDGAPGDSAARLVDGGVANLRLDPLVRLTSTSAPALVGLVPADCRIATSAAAAVEGNGSATRTWTPVPEGSWVGRDTARPAERWQVTCGGVLYSQGPAVPVDEVPDGVDLIAAGGLTHGAVIERWSGTIEGSKGVWTLTTTLLSGGGIAAVLSTGAGGGRSTVATGFAPDTWAGKEAPTADRDGWGLISTTVSSDPDVIAIRVPERSGAFTYFGERVLVVTSKPGAWSVMVRAGSGFVGTYLDNGVKMLTMDGGPVTVLDAARNAIGYTYVAEERDAPEYLGEKIVSAW